MKILLTGATGYIAQRLLPVLLQQGHHVVCAVRSRARFNSAAYEQQAGFSVIEMDLLQESSLQHIPPDIDAAYYLVHSMGASSRFAEQEERSASNFVQAINRTASKQVIYLSGIVNGAQLSRHLSSRKQVEDLLNRGRVPVTTLRAGIIVGSGSASFEIIRDLVEKLPIMVAPRWLDTKCQPIAIRNVVEFLSGILLQPFSYGKHYDIYGPDILTYKQMLLQYAAVRGLKRHIVTVPVMTPRLSSYWLYFVTSTSYTLARNLVESMRIDVVAQPNGLAEKLGIVPISYQEAIRIAFGRIEQNLVLSSWKDAAGHAYKGMPSSALVKVPEFGVLTDKKERRTDNEQKAWQRIFSIGGRSGWYYANWLWGFRGFLDKLFGGVGSNRGRKSNSHLHTGDAVDFWRVLYANEQEQRLVLHAEMKLPGEAWLELQVKEGKVYQTATFRPLGLWGRLYWYSVLPFHFFIFNGMIKKIADG